MSNAPDIASLFRATTEVDGGDLWFWIGAHADYDRLIG
jgi:hypothetical protein